MSYHLSHLRSLESESLHILREVAAEFRNAVLPYSLGREGLRRPRPLRTEGFPPGADPVPATARGYRHKSPEMHELRDRFCPKFGARVIVERNEEWIGTAREPCRRGAVAADRDYWTVDRSVNSRTIQPRGDEVFWVPRRADGAAALVDLLVASAPALVIVRLGAPAESNPADANVAKAATAAAYARNARGRRGLRRLGDMRAAGLRQIPKILSATRDAARLLGRQSEIGRLRQGMAGDAVNSGRGREQPLPAAT
jgi:hypothetical protein